MFDFLKKKLKESVDSLKNIFKKPEEAPPAKELEPVSEAEKEVMAEVNEEVKEEVKEEKAEEKKEEVKEEEKKHVLEEVKKVEKEAEAVEKIVEKIEAKAEPKKEEPQPEKKVGFFSRLFGKKEKKKEEPKKEEISEAPKPEIKEEQHKEEKKGLFAGLFEKTLNEDEFEKFFANLEISLLEANLAYEVTQLLKTKLKNELVGKKIPRGKGEEILFKTIEDTFRGILYEKHPDEILKVINEKKAKGEPTKFLFLGVNGVGKTTTLAKMCQWLKDKGYSVVISASDTFRAASIEQLEKHASRLGVNVIKHKYGGDPAAVAFDAIEHAKSKKVDVVLIDSAGRQHTSANLMDELKKLKRVAKPDFSIFVADAMTGNDAVEQAREFGEQIGFDFSILGKADVDQKGGAILSVSYVSGKPIAFLGVGQEYKDLEPFDREKLLKRIF